MSVVVSRKEIVEDKKIIASELAKLQKAYFDHDALALYTADDEAQLYIDAFDFLNEETLDIPTYFKTISLNHRQITTFTHTLATKLTELYRCIGVKEFYLLGHIKIDLFGNRGNKFKPLVESYRKLEGIVRDVTYFEAFQFDIAELADFLEILFWMERCDPSIPEFIFIFDKEEQTSIYLCKYGNIHLTEFGEERISKEMLNNLGWTIIEGEEFDNFTSNGRIKGR